MEYAKQILIKRGLPDDLAHHIIKNYILKRYARQVYRILMYGILVRKNYYVMKEHHKNKSCEIGLHPLWIFFNHIRSKCNCKKCNRLSNAPTTSSCYLKKMIHRGLSKYYLNVPYYKTGNYEKYISYITRKFYLRKRRDCKKNIIRIVKFCADFNIEL